MAWDPEKELSAAPLTPPERRETRRVLKWYERRAFLRASIRVWAGWLVSLPVAMLALWGLIQAYLNGH